MLVVSSWEQSRPLCCWAKVVVTKLLRRAVFFFSTSCLLYPLAWYRACIGQCTLQSTLSYLINAHKRYLTSKRLNWPPVASSGVQWPPIASNSLWWPLMAFDDLWLPPITSDNLRWPPIPSNAIKWSQKTSNDLQWPPMTSNDLQWSSMTSNDLQCHQMTSNDLQWPSMISNDLKMIFHNWTLVFLYERLFGTLE